MANGKVYNFGERNCEYSKKARGDVKVVYSPKYMQTKNEAIKMLEEGKYGLTEADFWILKNEKSDGSAVVYSGLLISHNACIKINSHLPKESRFVPSCVSVDKAGFGGSLVYTYINDEQGIYEIGEVSSSNCSNAYPNCMAFKRMQDRVILKLSALAEAGIYSEVESEEFKAQNEQYEEAMMFAAGSVPATVPQEEAVPNAPVQNAPVQNPAAVTQRQAAKPIVKGKAKAPAAPAPAPATSTAPVAAPATPGKAVPASCITKEQADKVLAECASHGLNISVVLKAFNINDIRKMNAADFTKCMKKLEHTPYYDKDGKVIAA